MYFCIFYAYRLYSVVVSTTVFEIPEKSGHTIYCNPGFEPQYDLKQSIILGFQIKVDADDGKVIG